MTFEPGAYFCGDLCYVLSDTNWDKLISMMGDGTGGGFELNNQQVFLDYTAHGDGEYFDYEGKSYSVDSGRIGIAPISLCENVDIESTLKCDLGHVVSFKLPFSVNCSGGVFYFGNITIPTDYMEGSE